MQFPCLSMILMSTFSFTFYGQAQSALPPNKLVFDLSAYSASLSDDTKVLAIGNHNGDKGGIKLGRVGIYKKTWGIWSQIGDYIHGEAPKDWSGYSVGLSRDGTTVAVGAKRNHGRNGLNSGHVRVYKINAGVWEQIGADIDGEAKGDGSGYSVSLSRDGTTVAIGAILNSGNGKFSGHVRVFKNNSGKWTQIGSDINGKAAKDYFGASVSLSGNGKILAVGAHRGGVPSGYVSVYKNISGKWVQIGEDIVGDPTMGNFSGWSISLSNNGNSLAMAAYGHDKGERYPYVRTYRNKASSWIQLGADIDGRKMGHDFSGFNSMNFDKDGAITFIGAYAKRDGNVPTISYLRKYKFENSSNKWIQE